MRLLIVGAGSTGGYFGARLARAGRDVTFLVRPSRADQLRNNGLQVVSPPGNLILAPRLVTADPLDGPYDAVLLTVKSFALKQAVADLAPAVGPDTMILPVQNGMGHVDLLRERFGAQSLVGCACKVATIIDDRGRIVQMTPLQDFAYGEMDGTSTPRIRALDALLSGAGFDARVSPDIVGEMWRKWVLLASVGAITCLMRGNVGEIARAPGGEGVIRQILDEVAAVMTAEGHPPGEEFLAATATQLTDPRSTQTSSMFRDIGELRPIEADEIIGDLISRGRRTGIAAPLLATAYAHLCVYSRQVVA